MPSFACASAARVASHDHTLCLKITHHLVYGSPSDVVHTVKGRLPKDCDVLWLSDVAIVLSGSLDGREIPAPDVARSGLARHLQAQLKANADRLGLNNVSHPFVDDVDGLTKLTLTPSRPLPHAPRPHANLVSLHLAYIWRTVGGRTEIVDSSSLVAEVDPFSPTLFLPAEALLNRVTKQLLIYHVVGRYPLIFGSWCKRLDLEMQYFSSIGNSILEIMARSRSSLFVSKCKRLLKIARSQHRFVTQSSNATLSSYADGHIASDTSEEETEDLSVTPVLTDEQVLCETLEQLFRIGVPQRRFKPTATPQIVSLSHDDDDNLLVPMPDEEIDKEACWVELPETAASPCGLQLGGFHQKLPEDMDIFPREDWSDDEMRRLDEADTSQGKREIDVQSEVSLISTPISFASVTADSQPACSLALYQHQGVDYLVQDPAASGLGHKVSQLAFLEDPGTPALYTNLTRSPHGHDSDHCEELIWHDFWACQVVSRSFERLDSCSEGEDSEWILFEEVEAPEEAEEVLV